MRYEYTALPWELMGQYVAMITLTYPAQWRRWAPDARAVVRHREALKEAWRRKWRSPPIGVWVMEFQPRERRALEERQAPHTHMYVGVPAHAVTDEEWHRLVVRVLERRRLVAAYGSYRGKGLAAKRHELAEMGEFSAWLLRTWWGIVRSGENGHRYRGADVTPAFWTKAASETANRIRIAEYFWRESGKWSQKNPPEDFGGLAFYGRWAGPGGRFAPLEMRRTVDRQVWLELRRVYRRYIDGQMRRLSGGKRGYKGPRGVDGLTVFNVKDAPDFARRMEEWAMGEATRKLCTGSDSDGAGAAT
jgi:hypothetical protein